ncbi:MAG: DUF3108 domain-containing protein [Paraglaciecola sp.]
MCSYHFFIKNTVLIISFLLLEAQAASIVVKDSNEISKLKPYTAKYTVSRGDKKYGYATRILSENSTSYTLTFNTNASMLFYSIKTSEKSTFLWQENKIIPLSYKGKDARTFKDDKRLKLNFDYKKNILSIDKSGKKHEEKLSYGILDPLLAYEAIRLKAIVDDKNFNVKNLQYMIYDLGGIKEYNFINSGPFIVETSLGELNCIKLSRIRKNSARKTHVWLAVDYDYIPIKILQENNNEEVATLAITSFIQSKESL